MSSLAELTDLVRQFRDQRNWAGFHTLPDLLISLSLETAEALEIVQWRAREGHALQLSAEQHQHLGEELADILAYLLLAADRAGVDLEQAFRQKQLKNAQKYPPPGVGAATSCVPSNHDPDQAV